MRNKILICVLHGLVGLLAGCGMLPGSANEEVRQEPNKTVYRSADEGAADAPATAAPHQKIPGE